MKQVKDEADVVSSAMRASFAASRFGQGLAALAASEGAGKVTAALTAASKHVEKHVEM